MWSLLANRRVSILAAVAITVCAAAGITASSSSAFGTTLKAKSASQACNTIDNVTEKTVGVYYVGNTTARMTEPGDTAIYYDNIYDSVDSTSGPIIGHAVGYMTGLYKLANGDLITQYYESVQLPGGELRDSGTLNRQAMQQGASALFAAVGTSGTYTGQRGYREWQIVPPAPSQLVSVKIVLCG